MRRPGLFVVIKQSRNERDSPAISPFEIFKNIFSCEVQHKLTIILLPRKYHQLVAALLESIDIRGSVHGDAHNHVIFHTIPASRFHF